MKWLIFLNLILSLLAIFICKAEGIKIIEKFENAELQESFGGNLHNAIFDIVRGFPTNLLAIVFDKNTDHLFISHLTAHLLRNGFVYYSFNVTTVEQQDEYFAFLGEIVNNYLPLYTLHFVTQKLSEHILIELFANKLIRSNLTFMFYWGDKKMYRFFLRNMHESMKIIVITNPRKDAYRLYYNQAVSYKQHNLQMVNWWIEGRGLFRHPTLPKAREIFKDFHGRLIYVPVIHKPPWHFVHYTNDSLEVLGGRDDKLIRLLAKQLNFRFEYFDPPERIQGTSFNINGTFDGVLGLIWEKEVEFFVGDIALTLERFKAVEFSFLTLADSGAFVTHAPSKLNEALALVRPFNPQVWPAIIITVILSGPVLFLIIILPNMWQPRFLIRSYKRLLLDCSWYTMGLFLKQTCKTPGDSHKSRLFVILLAVSATYVIGDMYAANLTSLLAKPVREKPVNNLRELEEAMLLKGYKLIVEKFSSSYGLLENGTGIYGNLWELMNANVKSPNQYLVDSVETGVKLVRDNHNIAVMAGRETLYFDIQRFGSSNFHLSEKLNTAYSAIALQLGCPYKENFNDILMGIFEAGILTKMTANEYKNLGKQQESDPSKDEQQSSDLNPIKKSNKALKKLEDDRKLQPISIRMLQGAFYLLGIGHFASGIMLGFEIFYKKHKKSIHKRKNNSRTYSFLGRTRTKLRSVCSRLFNWIRSKFREAMNDAIIDTFEYME